MPLGSPALEGLKSGMGRILLEPRSMPVGISILLELDRSLMSTGGNSATVLRSLWIVLILELWRRNHLDSVRDGVAIPSNGSAPVTLSDDGTGALTDSLLAETHRREGIS